MSKRSESVTMLRGLSAPDLKDHVLQQRRKLFEVRFQQATGQVENHRQLRVLRKEIARAITVSAGTPVADTANDDMAPQAKRGKKQ